MSKKPKDIEGEIIEDTALVSTGADAMVLAGQAANHHARKGTFEDYTSRRAGRTLRRQQSELANFAKYLGDVGITVEADVLQTTPEAWQGMTWGIVEGFKRWLLGKGYAVGSVNLQLSTVRTYAKLAFKAGAIERQEHALIRQVQGYSQKEGKRLDEKRDVTRIGSKKADAVRITEKQAKALKRKPPETPQGRRDALLMALLLDLGLRVGEVADLTIGDFDLKAGELTFYRSKVDKLQTHELKRDVLRAAQAWFDSGDAPLMAEEPVLRGSRKGGHLTDAGMSARAITARVHDLGDAIGIDGLSAHDCRHFWATHAARAGTSVFALQEAGGWNSPAMPARYVEASKIANEGIKGF